MTLPEFVTLYALRGECSCGRCADRGDAPDPTGHTVSTGFFTVALAAPDEDRDALRERFVALVRSHKGVFADLDMFAEDARHDFVAVGAWIGDQGLGMQCMALGHLLGAWHLVTVGVQGCVVVSLALRDLLGLKGAS